jgi:hypothetical protein
MKTHPEDFNFTFNLGHASRSVDISSSDQLHRDLFSPLHMEPKLDLPKLTLSQSLKQQIRAKLGNGATGVGGRVGYSCGVGIDVAIRWHGII